MSNTQNPVEVGGSTATTTASTGVTTIDTASISKQINDLVTWYNANPTKGQEFKDKLKAIADSIKIDGPSPPPPPPNPPSGGGGGGGGPGIGPDGIREIFPTNPNAKAKPFYINLDNPDENSKTFATTYGGDIVKFDKPAMENKAKYVRNKGHKQTYASGAAPGKSCRFHISAGGNNNKPGKKSWKDYPNVDYVTASDVCFYSHEMTVVCRVGKALGTHQSFAFKVNSRPDQPDDNLRSTIEFCMPNDQKGDAYVNYNYAHKTYSKTPGVKQYTKDGKITPGQIIGVKYVHAIAKDKKSTYMALYVNMDPIDLATGKFKNDGWKLKADYIAKGIKDYNNIPPVWGGDSYLRVDGYDYVDLFAFSQREILKADAQTANAQVDTTAAQEVAVPADDFNQIESPNEDADVDTDPQVVKAHTLIPAE